MTIYFSNPGSFDIRLLSTFGVNVKPGSPSPIGFFGTGLKYAVAGVLRLGGTVFIASGEDCWTVAKATTSFRGKEVEMCQLHPADGLPQDLPFSCDLGKHWEPWMIYREFRCNAVDEGGPSRPSRSYPQEDVVFAITCPAVEEVLSSHHEYFIEGQPIAKLSSVAEIYHGKTPWIYYKGVAVGKPSRPPLHKYNILSGLTLTEDRTASDWSALSILATAYALADQPDLIRQVVTAPKESFEHQITFDYEYTRSKTFDAVAISTAQIERSKLTPNMKQWANVRSPEAKVIQTQEMNSEQHKMLETAKKHFLHALGAPYTHEILLACEQDSKAVGFAWQGKCYLTSHAFKNVPELFSTLLEEHIHLAFGHDDHTREFQEAMHQIIRQLVFGPQVAQQSGDIL